MEPWQLHTLVETDDTTGKEKRQLGGAISGLTVFSATTITHEIEVTAIDSESFPPSLVWTDEVVCFRLGDAVVWMGPGEVEALIALLQAAAKAGAENVKTT